MAVTQVDVLVVGLGPSGASAAAVAAEAGKKVVAIERNAKAGLPVQCAEFVPLMMGYCGIPTPEFAVQSIEFMNTYIAGQSDCTSTPNFHGHMIDRASLDQKLVERACMSGVQCRFSTPLRAINSFGHAVLDNGECVVAKVIIGADGPRSLCGQAIGSHNRALVMTRQITVDLLEEHGGTDIFLSETYGGGYGWLFPKGSRCHVGLGVSPEHKANLKSMLHELHLRLIDERRVGKTVHGYTGGLIPVSGPVNPAARIGKTNFLLAGDAAGLTNPVTGAGINAAIISGHLAGEAAAECCNGELDFADDYRDEVEAIFGTSLRHAVRRREELLRNLSKGQCVNEMYLKRGWVAFPEFWERQLGIGDRRNQEKIEVRESA